FVEVQRQVVRIQLLAVHQVGVQQPVDQQRAEHRLAGAVQQADDVGAWQGLDLQVLQDRHRQAVEQVVADRLDFQAQQLAQRVEHMQLQRLADVAPQGVGDPALQQGGLLLEVAFGVQLLDGPANQRRGAQDTAFGFHVDQGRRHEHVAEPVQGAAAGVQLRQLLRLHQHLGADVVGGLGQHGNQQGDHGEEQEHPFDQLAVGKKYPQEFMQVVFGLVHDV